MINLDKAATTQPDITVINNIIPYLYKNYANPSSNYKIGKENRVLIKDVREQVAKYINCTSEEIIFTGSSSESNNAAIQGYVRAYNLPIICSPIEHIDILQCVNYFKSNMNRVEFCKVDKKGHIDLENLEMLCSNNHKALVIISIANNELGTIENIKEISTIVHKYNCVLLSDATQGITKIPIDVKEMGIDMISFGAHKIHGLKGCGVLYVKKGIELIPLVFGHQNDGKFGGTENVLAIASLGEALKLENKNEYIQEIRNDFEKKILKNIKNTHINGDINKRLPNISNICFGNREATTLQNMLNNEGVFCSIGSACNSESIEPSHVLKSIGLTGSDLYSCVRFSFDAKNSMEENNRAIKIIKDATDMLDFILQK